MRAVKRTVVKLRRGLRLVLRGEIWYVESCVQGIQSRQSLGTADFEEAKKLAFEGEDAPGPKRLAAPRAPAKRMTIGEAQDAYEKWYRGRYKKSGADQVMDTVQRFVDFVGADRDTRTVTRDEHVKPFIEALKPGRAAQTVIGHYAKLRAFLRWIARQDEHEAYMKSTICRGVDNLPKDDHQPKPAPDRDTVGAAIRAMRTHPWLPAYAIALAETGMRPSELLATRGTDLKEVRGKAVLSIEPWGGWSPKSKWSVRTIELNETCARVLRERVDRMFEKTAPIFGTSKGTRRCWSDAYHRFKRYLPDNMKHLTLYDLKHFFCSEHAAPGPSYMSPESLASYIGHSPKSTHTLMRWYVDRDALRRGSPPSLLAASGKPGRVRKMR